MRINMDEIQSDECLHLNDYLILQLDMSQNWTKLVITIMATLALSFDPYSWETAGDHFPSSSWSTPVPSLTECPSCLCKPQLTLYLFIVLEFPQQEKDKDLQLIQGLFIFQQLLHRVVDCPTQRLLYLLVGNPYMNQYLPFLSSSTIVSMLSLEEKAD